MPSVNSEVGPLREVIVHRPGVELSRLTPGNAASLGFGEVPWPDWARDEHDLFVKQLVDHGVTVHEFSELLTEALDADGAREFVAARLATPERFGRMLAAAVAELVRDQPAERLAAVLVGGLTGREASDALSTPSLLLAVAEPDDFVLAPLPNHLFQRDASAWIYGGVALSPLAETARRRETTNTHIVYRFHPRFRGEPPAFLHGDDPSGPVPASVEGGDVAVLGHHSVLVGMGERTTPQGVELLAQRLFETRTAERVIAVELPRDGTFLHLDSALTQVARDAYSVSPLLPERLRSWSVTPQRGGLAFHENDNLFRELSYALQVDRVRALTVPADRWATDHERRVEGAGLLAVAPGVVLGHERDAITNRYLEDHGVIVVPVLGSELGRGRGGPRCLTCPISREA